MKEEYMIELAEAQFTGFIERHMGYDIIDLINSMGLTFTEWDKIRNGYLFKTNNQDLKKEIDKYFNV